MVTLRDCETLSDAEIVDQVRAGEVALYEIILRRYNQRLFRIARSITGNDEEAEDVLQETYLHGYVHLDQFAGRAAFATWLTRIAIYAALARKRRRQPLHDSFDALEERKVDSVKSPDRGPAQQTLDREARALLEAAIDTLPDDYRVVFVMREIEEMTTAETAECLEITKQNVKIKAA